MNDVMNDVPIIAIVDDDASMRRTLLRVVQSAGYQGETFAFAREFLDWLPRNQAACLVLDVHMAEMNGFDLQERLAVPIIFHPWMSLRRGHGRRHRRRRFARGWPGPPVGWRSEWPGIEGLAQVAGGSGLPDALEGWEVIMGRDEEISHDEHRKFFRPGRPRRTRARSATSSC
jgi:hypothetical protein